jgi:hypothetical protein
LINAFGGNFLVQKKWSPAQARINVRPQGYRLLNPTLANITPRTNYIEEDLNFHFYP